MRILIDLQCCQSGSRVGGIGRYSMSLAKAMLRLNSPHEFSLLLNSRLPNENAVRAEFANLISQQNILTFEVPPYIAADNELPAHTRMAELIREKRIAEINPDVLHIASLFEGAGEDVVTSVGLIFPASRTAVTLYDLIPYLEQEAYLINDILRDHYLRKFEALKRAGMLVSISDFSRTEALQHTDIPTARIANISSAVDDQFAPKPVEADVKSALFKKAGIAKPFLMFTGSFDIRKNHPRLVEAFAKVPPAIRNKYQLVVVGKGEARQISKLRDIAIEHGLAEADLVFVGHVTDDELVTLYNLCSLFVFPSLREGFGLPVLEAMSCGVPTLGSNRTSVPEVINRADALFDPENVADISAKMTAVLADSALRADLKKHGLERAKHFSWALSAGRALEFFESTLAASLSCSPAREVPPACSKLEEGTQAYTAFLEACANINIGSLDDDFFESASHAIAVNEYQGRREAGGASTDHSRRLGWISCWDVKYATGAYSRMIIPLLPLGVTVFAPHSSETDAPEKTEVICSWQSTALGTDDDFSALQLAMAKSEVDTVVIQFEPDMFDWPALSKLVLMQKPVKRCVFVTLHTTDGLGALTGDNGMLEVKAALKSCSAIFVDTMSAVTALESFGVKRRVWFIPKVEVLHQACERTTSPAGLVADYLVQRMQYAIVCRA